MTEQRIFTDEELTAYLDHEADAELRKAIDNGLSDDTALKDQLAALTIDRDQIEAAFDSLLDHAPTAVELPDVKPRGGMNPILNKMAVAALVALIVGVGIGTKFSQDAKLAGWRGYVAAYHALYTEQTLASFDLSDSAAQDELSRASASIGKDISIETLRASDDLSFKRTQLLAFKGNPLLQLTFVTAAGEPVALCILKKPKLADSEPRSVILEGMPATSWSKDGYDFILIGGSDSKLIEKAAGVYASII